jgi:hypothetical protein
VAVELDMAYGARGNMGGGDVWVWMCWISLGMVGLGLNEGG